MNGYSPLWGLHEDIWRGDDVNQSLQCYWSLLQCRCRWRRWVLRGREMWAKPLPSESQGLNPVGGEKRFSRRWVGAQIKMAFKAENLGEVCSCPWSLLFHHDQKVFILSVPALMFPLFIFIDRIISNIDEHSPWHMPVSWHRLESFGTSVGKMSYQIGLWARLWSFFLIDNWCVGRWSWAV